MFNVLGGASLSIPMGEGGAGFMISAAPGGEGLTVAVGEQLSAAAPA